MMAIDALHAKLKEVQSENTRLRVDNAELEVENAQLKLDLERLQAEWNPPDSS
jgi:predicted nuclease with TOPRIM domain